MNRAHLNAHLLIIILGICQARAPDDGELIPQQDLDQVKLLIVHEGHQGGLCFSLSVVLNPTGMPRSDSFETICGACLVPLSPWYPAERSPHEAK